MTETTTLMKSHSSVRRFKEQEIPQADLTEILTAAQMASSWKNFQSYSVIVVRSQEKKDALFELVPQEAIRQSAAFLLFVGDLNRAEKGARLHTDVFQPQGVEGLLITSVDAALAGQNTLLAAESLGYGGVIIGLVRYKSVELAELFKLPDYTYPVFGIALGVPNQKHDVNQDCHLTSLFLKKSIKNCQWKQLKLMIVYKLSMLVRVRLPLGVNVLQSNSVIQNQVRLEKILNRRSYCRK